MPKNWNECVRRASGEFFALLPDDDEYEPRFLAMARALTPMRRFAFVQCGMTAIDENSRVIDTDLCSRNYRFVCEEKKEFAESWQFSTLGECRRDPLQTIHDDGAGVMERRLSGRLGAYF